MSVSSHGQVLIDSLKEVVCSLIYHSTNYALRETIFQPSLKDGWDSSDRLMFYYSWHINLK